MPKRSAFCQKSVGSLPPPQISHAPYETRLARRSWVPRIFRLPRPGKPDDHSIACQGAGKGAHSCCIRQDLFKSFTCTFDVFPGHVFLLELVDVTRKANLNQLYHMRLCADGGKKTRKEPKPISMKSCRRMVRQR